MARTTSGGKGGYRPPAKPAAVSGPGSLGRRTDNPTEKVTRDYQSKQYGQGVALQQQQQGAPLAGSPSSAVPGGAPAGAVPQVGNIFGPSNNPTPAPTLQAARHAADTPQVFPEDPNQLLRAMYSRYPHPVIAALLED